jgi:hypothetical protein
VEALAPIFKVANKLNKLYAEVISIAPERDQLIEVITKDASWKQQTDKPFDKPVLYKKQLAAALLELAEALEVMQLNTYSLFTWTSLGKRADTIKTGPDDDIGIHVAKKLGETISILKMRAERLGNEGDDPTIADVVVPDRMVGLAQRNILRGMGPGYRLPAPLRVLLQLGAEIWSDGLIGFFILVEICKLIPDKPKAIEEAMSCLLNIMNPIAPGIELDDLKKASPLLAVVGDKDCKLWMGDSFQKAVDEYRALPESVRQALVEHVL